MVKRLAAIVFIFICSAVAWIILGATIAERTSRSGSHLRGRVESVWGSPHSQSAPSAEYGVPVPYTETVTENGVRKEVAKVRMEPHILRPDSSDVRVDLSCEHRRKGLLWYSTYKVGFAGTFTFRNPDRETRKMRISLKFPAAQAIYDDLRFTLNGQPATPSADRESAYVETALGGGETATLRIGYRSQGLESWKYSFGQDVNPVTNFRLLMSTDFHDIDFPDNTLSPGVKRQTAKGWELEWTYANLLSGYSIAMTMPEKLQPGPLASQISFFAPVSLFFFFFLLFIVTTLRDIELHPMNYFFLAGAFFAFHLLLAYLVDHIDINVAFVIASAVSIFLVVSYLRLVTGTRFAIREAAIGQFIYLVLFSYAFFFKGFTGLAITIGAILTLFVVMQMTGRIRWSEKFAAVGRPRYSIPTSTGEGLS